MKKFALLIGINYENDEDSQLNGCINDITEMKQTLMTKYDFQSENCFVLSDHHKQPTKQNIINSFFDILTLINNEEECLVYIHYSGHGSQQIDTNNDEKDGYDEILVPIDCDINGFIPDDFIYEQFVKKINNSLCKLIFVMDCCHSGSIIDLPYQYKLTNNKYKKTKQNNNLDIKCNVLCISGCLDNQYSMDAYNHKQKKWNGAMTSALLKSLKRKKLFGMVKKIYKILKRRKMEQKPLISSSHKINWKNTFLM